MSATVAVPDSSAAAPSPAPSSAESELESYYNEIESRGDDTASASSATTSPAEPVVAAPTSDGSSADTTTTTTSPPTTATWDDVDNDPTLPPSLRGKSRREIYETNRKAIATSYAANQEKNTALRRAEVAEAGLAVLREERERQAAMAREPAAPPVAAPPAPLKGHELFGLPDSDSAFGAAPQIVDRLPTVIGDLADARANERVKPLELKIAVLEQHAAAIQQQRDFAIADNTYDSAMRASGIPDDLLPVLKPKLASIMAPNRLNPHNPEAWTWALNVYRADAARLVPQVAAAAPPSAAPNGNRTPVAAAPPTAAGARKFTTTGDKNTDAMVDELLSDYGVDKEKYRPRLIQRIRDEHRRGDDA